MKRSRFIQKQQINLIQNRLFYIKIEGTTAALKEFISAREVFFNKDLYSGMENFQNKKLVILDKYDVSAIGVFDLMHNDENGPYFDDLDSQDFADVVTDILNDNNFEISIKTVKTINDNTTLRLKHANSDFSANFKDAIVGNQQPVVLAHGMHSDLFTWNDFATDLATDPGNARDAWLIEMYGGPTTECSTCPVYAFSDLTEFYWPSLMAGVQHYSGQNNLSYVGYDLGCTVALESLENHSSGTNNIGYYFDTTTGDYNYAEPMDLSVSPIDTFVGVACIGNFTPIFVNSTFSIYPLFTDYLKNFSDKYQEGSEIYNFYGGHLPGGYYNTRRFLETAWLPIPKVPWYYAIPLSFLLESMNPNFPTTFSNKISMKVYLDIIDWISDTNNPKIGENVQLNNFAVIQSTFGNNWKYGAGAGIREYRNGTDLFVSGQTQKEICKNIDSNNKYYVGFKNFAHFGPNLPTPLFIGSFSKSGRLQKVVKSFLDEKNIQEEKSYEIISTNPNCE